MGCGECSGGVGGPVRRNAPPVVVAGIASTSGWGRHRFGADWSCSPLSESRTPGPCSAASHLERGVPVVASPLHCWTSQQWHPRFQMWRGTSPYSEPRSNTETTSDRRSGGRMVPTLLDGGFRFPYRSGSRGKPVFFRGFPRSRGPVRPPPSRLVNVSPTGRSDHWGSPVWPVCFPKAVFNA